MQRRALTRRQRGCDDGAAAVGRIRTREMRPVDSSALHEVFGALSPASRYLRFHAGASRLTAVMESGLLDLDGVRHRALLAEVREPDRWRPVGIARYVRIAATPAQAEVAIEVIDEWQGRGVGLLLLRHLSVEACRAGVGRLVGSVLPDNRALLTLLRRHFPMLKIALADGVLTVAIATSALCPGAA